MPEKEFAGREFTGYVVIPVFFVGRVPSKGGQSESIDSITKARLAAIKYIKRNKDVYTKGFIEETYGYRIHIPAEKVYEVVDYQTKRKTYWLTKEGNKTEEFRLNSKTGAIIETVKKTKKR